MAGAVAIVVSICTGEAFDQAVARRWGRTKPAASAADAPGPTKQASAAGAPGPTKQASAAGAPGPTKPAASAADAPGPTKQASAADAPGPTKQASAAGCARTDEAGFGSGCARTDEAGFGSSPAAYGVDGEAGGVDRAGVNGVVSPPRQAWSGCGLGAGRWCESTARRTPRWPSRTCAAIERHSPRLETVRLILRQQQAGPPPVCLPVAGVRPELARIAVPTPKLSAYDALVEGSC